MFSLPYGVVFLPWNEHILVADHGNHRVQEFDKNGKFITKWGSNGSSPGQFNSPRGVSFDPVTHQIIVVDTQNCRLQLYG